MVDPLVRYTSFLPLIELKAFAKSRGTVVDTTDVLGHLWDRSPRYHEPNLSRHRSAVRHDAIERIEQREDSIGGGRRREEENVRLPGLDLLNRCGLESLLEVWSMNFTMNRDLPGGQSALQCPEWPDFDVATMRMIGLE